MTELNHEPRETTSDRLLVDRSLRGDQAAFDELLLRCEPALRNLIVSRLRSRPEVAPEDALQELRLYLFQRLDRYNPLYPFRVFAIALGKNICKRFLYGRSDHAPAWPNTAERGAGAEDGGPSEAALARAPEELQQVLGMGRYAEPDRPPSASPRTLALLETFLHRGGYPHQQISFGYSILLWGRPKRPMGKQRRHAQVSGRSGPTSAGITKAPVTGDPDRVVREVGPRKLKPAFDDFFVEIEHSMRLNGTYVCLLRESVDRRLGLPGADLFAGDPTSARLFRHLAGKVTGQVQLREYFGKDGRKSVSDWTHLVKERTRKAYFDRSR